MVRYHRERRDLTLRDVAPRIGSSIAHLSDIERGRTTPGLDIAFKLAGLLRFSLDDLLGIDETDFEIEASDYRAGLERLHRAQRDITEGLALIGYLGLRAGMRRESEAVS